VEDDAFIGLALEASLQELGYGVIGPYLNLQDGLDHAQRDDIDFALLDFDLGQGTDAIPIAETLGGRCIPYVFVTAGSPNRIREFLPYAGIISKPVDLRVLSEILARDIPRA